MSYDLFEVPDGIEPLIGFRGWAVKGERLTSCYREVEWPIAGPLSSECIMPTALITNDRGIELPFPPKHWVSPQMHCTCGIYALNEFPHDWEMREGKNARVVKPWPQNSNAVVGMIQGWGKIVVGTKGFRAQYAKPIALISRRRNGQWSRTVEELAYVYGLEIVDVKEVRREYWRTEA